jgi:6-phosphogluconolactonase
MALSGGSTPWQMLALLAGRDIDWEFVHVFQVDERQAPDGDADRNLTHIRELFTDRVGIAPERVHAMPVTVETLEDGAAIYAKTLSKVLGYPAALDLVHLGMGSDGHTASLLPGDALLDETLADVGVTPEYQGHRRMSLTYPAINRARRILWLVNGADKAEILGRTITGDASIPAGRVKQERATVITDIPAADK